MRGWAWVLPFDCFAEEMITSRITVPTVVGPAVSVIIGIVVVVRTNELVLEPMSIDLNGIVYVSLDPCGKIAASERINVERLPAAKYHKFGNT